MKKITALFLSVALILSLAACKNKENNNEITAQSTVSSSQNDANNGGDTKKSDPALEKAENDAKVLSSITEEVINTSLVGLTNVKWNKKTLDKATMHDILKENGIDDSSDYYERTIDGVTLSFVLTHDGKTQLSGGEYKAQGTKITADLIPTKVCDTVEHLTADAEKLEELLNNAVKEHKNGKDSSKTFNGKRYIEATIHDLCVENNIDDQENYYHREIAHVEYNMVCNVNQKGVVTIKINSLKSPVGGPPVEAEVKLSQFYVKN